MVSPFIAFVLITSVGIDFIKFFTALTYIGVILVLFFANKENSIKFPNYLKFYLLFVLYVYYSAFFQLEGKFKTIYLVDKLAGAFNILFIIENTSISKKYFDLLLRICKKVLVIAIGVIIIQQLYDKNFFLRQDMLSKSSISGTEDRLQSIYSWVGILSVGLGFIPVLLIVVERLERTNKKIIVWIIFGLLYALLTKGRWMMINALLIFVILIVNKRDKFKHILKYIILIPLISITLYFTLNAVGINVKSIVEERVLEKGEGSDKNSASTRLLAITVFNKFYWKNAVFGVGDQKYGMGSSGRHNYELSKALGGKSSQIHVGYLSLFYTYGVIGGTFFITFLILIMRKLYKDAKQTTLWGPFLGILGLVFANFTLVYFSMLEIGLVFSLLVNKYYIEQNQFKLANQ